MFAEAIQGLRLADAPDNVVQLLQADGTGQPASGPWRHPDGRAKMREDGRIVADSAYAKQRARQKHNREVAERAKRAEPQKRN